MDIQVNLDILAGLENLVILVGQVFQDIAVGQESLAILDIVECLDGQECLDILVIQE